MSRFRTEIPISRLPLEIHTDSRILSLGSCFSEGIGAKLSRAGLDIRINPFGIIFNPISLASALNRLVEGREYTEGELIHDQGAFHSFDHHGRFSHASSVETIQEINTEFREATINLAATNVLIITLGSAWGYRHLESGKYVTNCHRIPQKEFEKTLIKSEKIVEIMKGSISSLSAVCDELQVILTVSPVRHWKDGPIQNQVSKSHLRIACDELASQVPNCHYFPAYELVLDELRDYRFYADDMLHPSSQTVDFIWEKFQEASMPDSLIERTARIEKLKKVIEHRSDNQAHLQRIVKAEEEIKEILAGS